MFVTYLIGTMAWLGMIYSMITWAIMQVWLVNSATIGWILVWAGMIVGMGACATGLIILRTNDRFMLILFGVLLAISAVVEYFAPGINGITPVGLIFAMAFSGMHSRPYEKDSEHLLLGKTICAVFIASAVACFAMSFMPLYHP